MKSCHKILLIMTIFGLVFSGCRTGIRFSADNYKSPKYASKNKNHSSKNKIAESRVRFGKIETREDNENTEETGDIVAERVEVVAPKDRSQIVDVAEEWLGTPYKWGGESKEGADCSGFVQSIYHNFGIKLPRTAADQYDYSERVDSTELQVGDLLFFKKRDRVTHVGIYIGNNQMIHASSKRGVVVQDLTHYNYYRRKSHFAGIGRVINYQ